MSVYHIWMHENVRQCKTLAHKKIQICPWQAPWKLVSNEPPPPPPPPSSYAPTYCQNLWYCVQFVAHSLGIWFSSNATSEFPILPWPIPLFCCNSQQIFFVKCYSLNAIQFASPTKVFFVRIDRDVIVWRNALAFHWTLTLKRSPKSRWLSFLRFFVAISCVFILFFFAICSHLIWSSRVFYTSPSAHFQPHQSSFYRPHRSGFMWRVFLTVFIIIYDSLGLSILTPGDFE